MEFTLEYIVIGVYLAFLISMGVIFACPNRNLSNYVRGGAQGTWWLVGMSMLMYGISAFALTATPVRPTRRDRRHSLSMLFLLLLVPNDFADRIAVGSIGLFVVISGLLLRWAAT